ncbi:hypothetical protein WJX84_008350 [Apatococcus fuscideae]|uniref:Uncharacterized protein n=1 Tax=Apatococcus fuscideae TaxID=2026836 RepID=A0AAW1SW61_9CHLO
MLRYQGVDWQDKVNWGCNRGVNPTGENHYDGMSLDPLEVLFVKMKAHIRQLGWPNANQAQHYQEWKTSRLAGASEVQSNDWLTKGDELRLPRILMRQYMGDGCFDHSFYRAHNRDLPTQLQTSDGLLWRHFVMHGEHEGRVFRFTCTPSLPSDAKAAYAEARAMAQAAAGTSARPQQLPQQLQHDPGSTAICQKLFGAPDQGMPELHDVEVGIMPLFGGRNDYIKTFLGCP